MNEMQYRLTAQGKRLYWLFHGLFPHMEMTPEEFCRQVIECDLAEGARDCLCCHREFNSLVAGMFCIGCTASTYDIIDFQDN